MVTRDLTLFGHDLNECDEGIWMFKNKTKLVGRLFAAGALSVGMIASAVTVASASDHGGHHSGHDGGGLVTQSMRVEGVVTAYSLSGLSISLTTRGSSSPVTYVLTTTTTVNGLAATATAPIVGDNVDLVLSTTLPTTVTSIVIDKVHGIGYGGFDGKGSHNFAGNAGRHHGGGRR